jgi:hypothetical protein
LSSDGSTLTRDFRLAQVDYSELLLPGAVRNGADGYLGVATEQTFLVGTSQISRIEIFTLCGVGHPDGQLR